MPSSEYTAKLTQDDGATLLLRLAPNLYSEYSADGVVWYTLTVGANGSSSSLDPADIPLDNVTIYWNNGRLSAKQQIQDNGLPGDVLTYTGSSGGWSWERPQTPVYGDGLTVTSGGTVCVAIDESTLGFNSSGILYATPQIPTAGSSGYVLTKDSQGYGWEALPTSPNYSNGLSLDSNTLSVKVDNETITINNDGAIQATEQIPQIGTTGYVLTKTDGGYAWMSPSRDTYNFSTGLIVNSNTVSVDIGTSGGQIVALDSSGKIPETLIPEPLAVNKTCGSVDITGVVAGVLTGFVDYSTNSYDGINCYLSPSSTATSASIQLQLPSVADGSYRELSLILETDEDSIDSPIPLTLTGNTTLSLSAIPFQRSTDITYIYPGKSSFLIRCFSTYALISQTGYWGDYPPNVGGLTATIYYGYISDSNVYSVSQLTVKDIVKGLTRDTVSKVNITNVTVDLPFWSSEINVPAGAVLFAATSTNVLGGRIAVGKFNGVYREAEGEVAHSAFYTTVGTDVIITGANGDTYLSDSINGTRYALWGEFCTSTAYRSLYFYAESDAQSSEG